MLTETIIKCVSCGKTDTIYTNVDYEIPPGRIRLVTGVCGSCVRAGRAPATFEELEIRCLALGECMTAAN